MGHLQPAAGDTAAASACLSPSWAHPSSLGILPAAGHLMARPGGGRGAAGGLSREGARVAGFHIPEAPVVLSSCPRIQAANGCQSWHGGKHLEERRARDRVGVSGWHSVGSQCWGGGTCLQVSSLSTDSSGFVHTKWHCSVRLFCPHTLLFPPWNACRGPLKPLAQMGTCPPTSFALTSCGSPLPSGYSRAGPPALLPQGFRAGVTGKPS